ncbi:Exosome component 5 [Mactra antiquata]
MKMSEQKSGSQNVLRLMVCEMAHLSRPDGSATTFQGDTCVMTSVYGPTEVRMAKEQIDRTTVEVVYKPKSGLPSCAEKSLENIICNTCENILLGNAHPRSAINITVQEVQDSGSFTACCINCCCLALLDAGIGMKCTMAAVNCCIDNEENIIVDPTRKEEEQSQAVLTFAFDSKDKNIITVITKGKYSQQQFQKCLVLCRDASDSVFKFYRETMEKKLSKT